MCIVLARERYSKHGEIDAAAIRSTIAGDLLATFPPFVRVTSSTGCDLHNEKRQTSKDDLVTAPLGTELVGDNISASLVATNVTTAVVSVMLLDFTSSPSLLHKMCDTMIKRALPGEVEGDQWWNLFYLLCYPSAGKVDYLLIGAAKHLVSPDLDMTVAAVRVLDADWRVTSPRWRTSDFAWLVLWLLPIWAAVLLPAVVVCRAALGHRRAAVLQELERALDAIEVDKNRNRFHGAEAGKAVRQTRWLARTVLLLAVPLLPWLPALAVLPVALPLSQQDVACAAWVKSRASRRFWLLLGCASGVIYCAWLLASWSLTYSGEEKDLNPVGEIIVWHKVFVSECHQLIGQRDEYESFRLGGKNVYYPFHGKVCSAYLHAIRPENAPIFAWTLFGQGCASLLLACVSGALLLKSAGCKAVPGGRYLAAFARCGATSVDGLLAGASERVSDRFAGSAKELVTGQPEEAATGLYGIIGYEEAYLRERMAAGTAAIVAEAEALGDPEVLENLRYILDAPAGSSNAQFHNGWRRDRAPDGSSLRSRRGMRLADFVALPVARRARLEEAHVVALRLYSTAAFRALNGPMRNLKLSPCRKDEAGNPLPLEPPQLAAPHPQPVTMAFIYEALKRMRAVAAATTVDPECKKMEELAVAGELSLETLRQASRQARRDEEGGDEESQQEGSGLEEGRATGVSKSSYLGSVDQSVGEGHGERTGAGRGSAPLSALQAVARAFGCERPAKPEEGRILWRGMGDMLCSPRFLALGGTEFACCSTTSRLEVAAHYACAAGEKALLFRIKSSTFMNMGVDISDFSAFPHEQECLYPPLTYLHPTGVTHRLVRDDVEFDVVEVEPSFPS